MPDTTLRDLVLKRLDADTKPEDAWSALVLAALESPAELEGLLEGPLSPRAPSAASGGEGSAISAPAPSPRIAFLRTITVEGFRGIGPKATLDLTPGPGLTLVVGRNGSGKSSFAEGLELLLTGDTYRWKKRSVVWRDGWRNLHHPKAALAADFALEGERGACTVACEWPEGPDLEAATSWAQVKGQPRTTKDALGWKDALESHRPFLSYNELGSMLDEGPSKLYDALAKVLGLDALVDAQTALQQARAARDSAVKEADRERKQILTQLDQVSDARAGRVKAALTKKDWALDEVEAVLAGSPTTGDKDSGIDLLKRLALLQPPDPAAVAEGVKAVKAAEERQQAAAQSVAGKSDQLASLLDHALSFHTAQGDGPCPVCGNPNALDKDWHEQKAQEAESLRQAAREATEARKAVVDAKATVQRMTAVDWDLVKRAGEVGLRHPEGAAWPSPEGSAIADSVGPLSVSLEQLRQQAVESLQSREDTWRPQALALAEWLPKAVKAVKAGKSLSLLKPADKWLKDAADAIRNERFAPIADQTKAIWDQLRLQSNVSLEDVHLGGAGKARKVELKVTVDGQEGAALGVMSQGELHSLALSLFIPRATLEESPFRFVVIDDPVQSMDPARVDGLAKVLQSASQHRQVVVFTHDDRLPEAVRRLGVAATVVEVTRQEGSLVAPRPSKDPVSRTLEDAFTLAKTSDLPQEVARRVVPGLCRQAIEAACMESIRRRRIGRGEPHVEVEALLAGVTGTKSLAALALFDDQDRAGEVLPRLNRESKAAADTFRAVNEGSHEALPGDMLDVVRSSEKLATWMQKLA